MSVIKIIQARSPSSASARNIDDIITIADALTSDLAFEGDLGDGTLGTRRELAVALRALHMIAREQRDSQGTSGGAVASESEGGLSRSYNLSPADVDRFGDLCTTTWGIELISLIKSSVFSPMTAM